MQKTGDESEAGLGSNEVAAALEQLHADKKTPLFLKTLISHMFSVQKQLCSVLAKNQELQEQISCLREENMALKSALAEAGKSESPRSFPEATANVVSLVEEKERQRSVVISGIPESKDPKSTERALHDLDFVKSILNHLEIECIPQITYRLGKPQADRPRLVKVLLPNTFYKSLILRRAPRLRSFSSKGVYIRPSLTKEERERNREAWLARRVSHNVSAVDSQRTQLNVSSVNS